MTVSYDPAIRDYAVRCECMRRGGPVRPNRSRALARAQSSPAYVHADYQRVLLLMRADISDISIRWRSRWRTDTRYGPSHLCTLPRIPYTGESMASQVFTFGSLLTVSFPIGFRTADRMPNPEPRERGSCLSRARPRRKCRLWTVLDCIFAPSAPTSPCMPCFEV